NFYATDGWSRRPEARRDRRCTKAVLGLIELGRRVNCKLYIAHFCAQYAIYNLQLRWCQRRATIPQPPRCRRGTLPVELRWCWSDREDSNFHRLCIRQVHSTIVLRSVVGRAGFE